MKRFIKSEAGAKIARDLGLETKVGWRIRPCHCGCRDCGGARLVEGFIIESPLSRRELERLGLLVGSLNPNT